MNKRSPIMILRMLRNLYQRISLAMRLNSYDDFTIAEYFREQGAQIGEDNRIQVRSFGPEPYLIRIGDHCTIASNVQLLVHDGGPWVFTNELPTIQKFGPIEIKDNCFIGMNAIVMPNVSIGPNSIVGAGSVVTKDVLPNTVVAGNPAKDILSLKAYKEKTIEIWRQMKPRGYLEELVDNERYDPTYIQRLKNRDSHILKGHLMSLFGRNR